jgi:hypothetical protein
MLENNIIVKSEIEFDKLIVCITNQEKFEELEKISNNNEDGTALPSIIVEIFQNNTFHDTRLSLYIGCVSFNDLYFETRHNKFGLDKKIDFLRIHHDSKQMTLHENDFTYEIEFTEKIKKITCNTTIQNGLK